MQDTTSTGRVDAGRPGFMTPAHAAFYEEQGYLVAENALDRAAVDELLADAAAICRGGHGEFAGFEPAGEDATDDEVLRRYLCIHFPHKMSPVMHAALAAPAMVEVLTSVIGPDVKSMQSMLFIKAGGKPGQPWHQDEDYIPTRDRSLCGGWIALDDATEANGCLWVIPGSHRPGVLYPQAYTRDPRFDCNNESHRFPYRDEDAVPVPVKAGSIVFFNGYLLHRSLPNRTDGYRRCLVNHYMSASSLLPWTGDLANHRDFLDSSRSVAKADHRDVVMVAGEDPYAWMGTHDRVKPHVRGAGSGGCAKDPAAEAEAEPAAAASA